MDGVIQRLQCPDRADHVIQELCRTSDLEGAADLSKSAIDSDWVETRPAGQEDQVAQVRGLGGARMCVGRRRLFSTAVATIGMAQLGIATSRHAQASEMMPNDIPLFACERCLHLRRLSRSMLAS
jgi:hypothetical protein